MKDLKAHLEKLRADAEDCALISKLATDRQKRELFARLALQLSHMAHEVELALRNAAEDQASCPDAAGATHAPVFGPDARERD
jgi:hypothetical protein